MNSTTSRPRLICRVVRPWCALTGKAAQRHVSRCTDCQAFFAAGSELDAALHRGATRVAATPDSNLGHRILQAVRAERRSTAPDRRRQSSLWLASAAAAALAVVVVVLPRRSTETEMYPSNPSATQADAEAMVTAVQTLSSELVDTVIPAAGAIAADNPMQRELNSIYADARSAVGFLAMNFLPSSSSATTRPGVSTLN